MKEGKERLSFHDQIQRNKLKSIALIAVILLVFILLGYLISLAVHPTYFFAIMILAIIFSILYTVIGYYNSDKIALASVRAKPASQIEHRMLIHSVESMAIASGLPMPKVYIMESDQINAFASGRDPQHAVICVTTGMLNKLNKQELEGVIAHEMSHIRFMTLTAILVGMIAIIAQIFLRSMSFSNGGKRNAKVQFTIIIMAILAAVLAPIVANLVSFAISRKREFTADATAVKFTRYSAGLKSALQKIKGEHPSDEDKKRYPSSVAPLFISDPFKKKLQGLFSTHPPIEERIRRLSVM